MVARACSWGCLPPNGSSAQNSPFPPAGASFGTASSIANVSLEPGPIGLAAAQLRSWTSTWPDGTSCTTYDGQRSKETVDFDVLRSTTSNRSFPPRSARTGWFGTDAEIDASVQAGTGLTLAVSNGETPISDGRLG